VTTPEMTPEHKQMVAQAQEMIDRRKARLGALSRTLTSTDRIITGRRDIAVFFGSQKAGSFTGTMAKTPAYTDGADIAINDKMLPDIRTKSGLVTTLGLNYHELAHNLYTPGKGTQLVSAVLAESLWDTYNLLEDSRIETLMVAKYRSAAKFLTQPVLEFIIKDENTWATAHLYVHGRRFISKEVRKELRDVYQGDEQNRTACENVIDEYRKLDLSKAVHHQRALELVRELDGLINALRGDLSTEEAEAMQQHSGCKGIGDNRGKFNNSMMKIKAETEEASRRRDEQDAVQEEQEAQEAHDQEGDADDDDTEDEAEEEAAEEGPEDESDGDAGDVEDDSTDDDDRWGHDWDEEDGDGGEDSEEDIDEEDDEDGVSGDEPEGDDEGDEGSSSGGPSGSSAGDVGDDGDPSGDDSSSDDVEDEDGGPGGSGVGVGAGSLEELAETLAAALEDLEGDSEVEDEVSRLQEAMDDDNLMDSVLEEIPYKDVPVDADAARSASMVLTELQRLNTQFEAGWNYGTDHGRLNTQRAMTADWGDTDIFDHWEEGREQDAAIEAVFTVDRSGSMEPYYGASKMKPACTALWVLKRAIDEVDGLSTVLTFDSGQPYKLYGRGEEASPNVIRQIESSGGTDPHRAVDESRRILSLSERPNKLYVMITDGMWGVSEDIKKALLAVPGTRVFIGIGTGCDDFYRDAFDVIAIIQKADDITDIVRKAVVSMLDEAIKRR
jgi:hypothetical protein